MAKIEIDTSRFEVWFRSLSEEGEEALRLFQNEGSILVMAELAKRAPRRTGQLIASIMSENTGTGFEVYPTVPYAKYVEYGAGLFGKTPHLIYPKKASVLRWEQAGYPVFARYIRGQPGQFFVARTWQAVIEPLTDLARKIWRTIISATGP